VGTASKEEAEVPPGRVQFAGAADPERLRRRDGVRVRMSG